MLAARLSPLYLTESSVVFPDTRNSLPAICWIVQAANREAVQAEEREAAVTRRLQHKIAKRVRFFEKVAASKPAPALGVKKGGTKKKRRKEDYAGRLGDLSSLSASLAEAAQNVRT
jgi:hypothetical protein